MPAEQQSPLGQTDPKTVAIISYITFIGWLVAYFAMYSGNKSRLAGFHLRQTLFLHILSSATYFLLRPVLGLFVFITGAKVFLSLIIIVNIGFFVLWLLGLISAINAEEKPMPLIGDAAQRIFYNL